MKKTIYLIAIFFMFGYLPVWAQSQMEHWYISPDHVSIPLPTVSPLTVLPIPTPTIPAGVAPPATGTVANGMYDNSGNLLFYVSENGVYDNKNSLIGFLTPGTGAEIAIVPFANNNSCQRRFNIFSTAGGVHASLSLWRGVLDMNNYTITNILVDEIDWLTCAGCAHQEFGAIAVSGIKHPDGYRFLYFLAGSGFINTNSGAINIERIYNDGTVIPMGTLANPHLYPTAQYPNPNSGGEVFSRELDLSPDGKWLGWASYHRENYPGHPGQKRYHLLHLDPQTGVLDPFPNGQVYWPFNIDPSFNATYNYIYDGMRGVEFWQFAGTTKFFMGAGSDGIYAVDLPSLTNTNFTNWAQVAGSYPTFGFSQIEFAHDGKMYTSSSLASSNVAGFDPSSATPSINSTFTLTLNPGTGTPPNAPFALVAGTTPSSLFTLPDQMDGLDYTTILPATVPQVVTTGIYNFPVLPTTFGSSATWGYTNINGGSNPWSMASTTIPNYVHVNVELHIRNNSHLTIEGMTFRFGGQAKVRIDPGCSLTLNGTTFTADFNHDLPCNFTDTWVGVEVHGTSGSQSTPSAEGKLTLINHSTIQYAQWGARTKNINGSISGGIITAKNSHFISNNVDVEFNHYQNFNPSNNHLLANRSYFSNSDFTADQFYPFTTAPRHVTIDNCYGISFVNCQFSNQSTTLLNAFQSMGINSIDGGFSIAGVNSAFTNLYYGINATKSTINSPIRIYNTTFTDNKTSIVSNINNIIVQRCTFHIGGNLYSGSLPQVGIQLLSASGYSIEENNLKSSANAISGIIKQGIVTDNSGQADNQIYKNFIVGIDYGNIATKVNRDNSNGDEGPALHGLQYLCNQNQSNPLYDFFIGKQTGSFPFAIYGIRSNQGTLSNPAGNTFSHVANGTPSNINDKAAPITYNYWTGSTFQEPTFYNFPTVTLSAITVENTCPSNIPCIGCNPTAKLTVEEIQHLNSVYDSSETAYLNLLYAYNALMDGGSTNALLNQIQQSWTAEADSLRDTLLGQSPYLSQTVLREIANENVLPQAMLLEVCMANPDATKDERFLDFLQFEIPNPLPQYMIDMIIASWNIKTARTTMENTLGDYSHKMAITSDKLLADLYFRSYIDSNSVEPTDTTDNNFTIRYWLRRVQTLIAKYDLIENYLAAGDQDTAEIILESLPYNFNMSEDQKQAYNDYTFYFNFRKDSVDLSHLNESQIQALNEFSQDGDDFAKVMVQSLLCFYYHICTEFTADLESGGDRVRSHTHNSSNLKFDVNFNKVFVSPNPATTSTTFKYSLQTEKAILVISDMSGKEIEHIMLKNKEGQQIWDTRNINSGTYYFSVTDGITTIAKGKVAVAK